MKALRPLMICNMKLITKRMAKYKTARNTTHQKWHDTKHGMKKL